MREWSPDLRHREPGPSDPGPSHRPGWAAPGTCRRSPAAALCHPAPHKMKSLSQVYEEGDLGSGIFGLAVSFFWNDGSVESLQSHCTHTMSHWSSGLPVCFPSWGTWVQSPVGYLCETRILLLVWSCYISDPNVIDHCGLIWGGLSPKLSLDRHADNVIIPLDLTQFFFPGFTLAAGPPFSFTTDIVGCWGGVLSRACNLTAFTPCLTGLVDYPFASRHEGPGFNPQGGICVKLGFSCERCLATVVSPPHSSPTAFEPKMLIFCREGAMSSLLKVTSPLERQGGGGGHITFLSFSRFSKFHSIIAQRPFGLRYISPQISRPTHHAAVNDIRSYSIFSSL